MLTLITRSQTTPFGHELHELSTLLIELQIKMRPGLCRLEGLLNNLKCFLAQGSNGVKNLLRKMIRQ